MASSAKAWAGGALDAAQPPVASFHLLEDASEFLLHERGRAVGFFASVNAPEHTVFLTVAKQLGQSLPPPPQTGWGGKAEQQPVDVQQSPYKPPSELSIGLGRATVGRGSRGATVYLVPRVSAVIRNATSSPPLLIHQYRLPASPQDQPELRERWEFHTTSTSAAAPASDAGLPPPAPPPPEMWQAVLEAEAVSLHRFLLRGALDDVSELSPRSIDTLAAGAHRLGVLLLPSSLNAQMRRYHLRRLALATTSFPTVRLTRCAAYVACAACATADPHHRQSPSARKQHGLPLALAGALRGSAEWRSA